MQSTTIVSVLLPARHSTLTSFFPVSALAAAMAVTGIAGAGGHPQFVDSTAAQFPSPGLLEYTNQATMGDLDGDGDLDIIFANGGGFFSAGVPQKLRVFINDGNGTFTDETDARTGGLTFLARGAELGDIERDGDLDIIVAQDFNRQPTILVNDGAGVFTNETAARLPIGTFSSTRAQFADVDNDGDLDLYFTNGGNVSRWGSARGKLWLNDGTGVFTDVTTTHTPNLNTSEPQDAIFGDVDGDLDLDIRIGSTASNQGRLFINDGTGVFTNVGAPPDNNCYSYDFGDMDGNGSLDLLGANAHPSSTNSELALFNDGTGTFTQGSFTGSATDDNDSKFLDIDDDGDLDLLIASLGPTERVYTNNGTGTFTLLGGAISFVGDSSLDIKVGDLNGDGRYDVITAQGESGSFLNRIYMNNGAQDTRPPTIVRMDELPDTDQLGPFVVRAVIYDAHTSDRGFFPQDVSLWWRQGDGAFAQVEMDWSGNSLWRGEIPAQKTGGTVEYYVESTDAAGNIGASDVESFTIDFETACLGDLVDTKTFQPPPDGAVDGADLAYLLGEWGRNPGSPADMVTSKTFLPPPDGMVDGADLAVLLGGWGDCQ